MTTITLRAVPNPREVEVEMLDGDRVINAWCMNKRGQVFVRNRGGGPPWVRPRAGVPAEVVEALRTAHREAFGV